MKTSRLNYLALLLLALTIPLCFTACAGPGSTPNPQVVIQPLLDRIVPTDFEGDGEFGERGQYLEIEVRVGGLHKTASGAWSWKWLAYRRTVTIPIAPGVPYRQTGWVSLGTPTIKP